MGKDVGYCGRSIVGAIERHRLKIEQRVIESCRYRVGVGSFGVVDEFEFVGAEKDGGVDVEGDAVRRTGGSLLWGACDPVNRGGEGTCAVGLDVDASGCFVEHINKKRQGLE